MNLRLAMIYRLALCCVEMIACFYMHVRAHTKKKKMKMRSGRICILFFHTLQHSATHCNTLQHAIRALSHLTVQTHSSGLLPPVGVFAERLLRVRTPKVALNSRWLFFWHLHACLQSFRYAHTDRDEDRDRYRDRESDRCTRALARVLILPLSLPHSYTHTHIHTYTHTHTQIQFLPNNLPVILATSPTHL